MAKKVSWMWKGKRYYGTLIRETATHKYARTASGKTKTIVNISSLSKYPGVSGNQSGYSAHKAALSHHACLLMFKPIMAYFTF